MFFKYTFKGNIHPPHCIVSFDTLDLTPVAQVPDLSSRQRMLSRNSSHDVPNKIDKIAAVVELGNGTVAYLSAALGIILL